MVYSKTLAMLNFHQLLPLANSQTDFNASVPSIPEASNFIRRAYHSGASGPYGYYSSLSIKDSSHRYWKLPIH